MMFSDVPRYSLYRIYLIRPSSQVPCWAPSMGLAACFRCSYKTQVLFYLLINKACTPAAGLQSFFHSLITGYVTGGMQNFRGHELTRTELTHQPLTL